MKSLIRWIPAVVIMSIIFYLSSRSDTSLAPTFFWNYIANKMAHLLAYFSLALAFYIAVKSIRAAILLTIIYAITDEIHQTFIFNRTGRASDVILDGAAASLMGVAVYVFNRLKEENIL